MPANRITQLILLLAIPTGIATALSSISVAVPPGTSSGPSAGVLTTLDPNAWINIRSAPNTDAQAVEQGISGESVAVLQAQQGGDGFTWYLVRSTRSQAQGWVRGDLIRVMSPAMPLTTTATVASVTNPTVSDANPFPEYNPTPVGSSTSPNPFARNQNAANIALPTRSPANSAPMPYQPMPNSAPAPLSPAAPAPREAPMPYQQRVNSQREFVFEQHSQSEFQRESRSAPPQTMAEPYPPAPAADLPPVEEASTAWLPARPPTPLPSARYSSEQIEYFMEVAMGAEFGETGGTVRKWSGPIRIRVNGTPTREDMATLNAIVQELNDLTEGIDLQLTNSNPNIDLHFAPEAQFRSIEPNYRSRNMGFFWTWWNGGEIYRARILISTTGVTQQERSHLLREELTQSLGLMRDSNRYADSVFYQGWTDVNQYAPIDRAIISMLYRPQIRAGMSRTQVLSALQNLGAGDRASTCGIQIPFTDQRFIFPWDTCTVQ